MFTGIVEAVGRIIERTPAERGVRLRIETAALDLADVEVGDSIAVNGVCLTAVTLAADSFTADVSAETLSCTIGFDQGNAVNLEKALRLGDRLGGHMVTGHVDGIGEVVRFEALGESWLLVVRVPAALARYVARKGSVTVNGVSLTVNAVDAQTFDANLIPHTLANTNLKDLSAGAPVNIEVDLVARYIERMLPASN